MINTPLAASLHDRITNRTARVGVVGLGYVGRPLLVEIRPKRHQAVGFDLDVTKVGAIVSGGSYIPDVPDQDVETLSAAGRLFATTDFSELETIDTLNICVPTSHSEHTSTCVAA